jgi:hypothetical protein
MHSQLSNFVAQAQRQELVQAAERARAMRDYPERTRSSRRFRWTLWTPRTAAAASAQVRVA